MLLLRLVSTERKHKDKRLRRTVTLNFLMLLSLRIKISTVKEFFLLLMLTPSVYECVHFSLLLMLILVLVLLPREKQSLNGEHFSLLGRAKIGARMRNACYTV